MKSIFDHSCIVILCILCQIEPFANSSLIYTKDMTTALGFRYQTPMGYILQGLGVSLSWMGLGVHSFQHPDWNIDPAKAYACLVQ